jgi:hypothetical protein
MSIYQQLLQIDESTFDRLYSLGLFRYNVKRDLQIYAFYLRESQTCGSMQAMTNAATEFMLSEDAIQKIVYAMRAASNKK